MAEPVLTISGLSVDLGREAEVSRVLDGVDLSVGAGEIVALVGESGSGKSTIGRAVQGLLPEGAVRRIAGSIRLDGQEMVGASATDRRRARQFLVRSVPQNPMGALNPTMRIGRQMAESGADADEAARWLARTGLPDPERVLASYPHRLSGGQRQRVMIAMAMVARPHLLIADEPTTALDVTVQAQILELIASLRGEGTAVLFVTHDLSVAAGLADRILVCYAGRIVEDGPASAVVHAPQHPYAQALLAARFDLRTDRTRPLLVGSGAPPEVGAPGCTYGPRCHRAELRCAAERPLPHRAAPHRVACHNPVAAGDGQGAERRDAARWPVSARPGRTPALEMSGIVKIFPIGPRDRWGRRSPVRVLDGVDLTVAEG